MQHLLVLFVISLFSYSCAKYCSVYDGNGLQLICPPEDTKPIHVINGDSVGCENGTETVLRENIKKLSIATCKFDDFNLFKNFTDLKYSNFHDIKSMRKDAFVGMDQVKYISIRYSNVEVLESAFSDLPNLRQVNIIDNKLKLNDLAFSGAYQLKLLSLHEWLRSSLPLGFFRDLNNLEYLSLGRHFENLSDINFTGLEKLKTLQLNLNHIKNLTGNSFSQLKNLKYLYLDYNRLSEFGSMPFSTLQNLIFLNLEGNDIEELSREAFSGLSNLRCLLIHNNQIRSIESGAFTAMQLLKKLDLTNNRLTSLNENTFKGLVNLQYLSLRENAISTIDVNTFVILPKLVQLDLSKQSGWPRANLDTIDLNAFPQFVDLQTMSVIQTRINDESDDFEKAELEWIKNIFSLQEDHHLSYYKLKYFGSFRLNRKGYPQTDLNDLTNISSNVSVNYLVFGNLDLSDNEIVSINLTKN